jgi:adenosine deaminase
MELRRDTVKALPKIVLHDHLDGGLRPETIIELAGPAAHALPTEDPAALGEWFVAAADSGSLVRYLDTFVHTAAVTQTADNLARVAREAVVDLADDGAVYAELRFAPEQHLAQGLTLDEVVDAVLAGLAVGCEEAMVQGHEIQANAIVCAMRQGNNADAVSQLALRFRERGVVGFDLAGPEAGFPASRYVSALNRVRDASFPTTIHAGEAFGPASIGQAVHAGGAIRIGHGVRIVEDIDGWRDPATATLGELANWVRDRHIPLEMCPTSNRQTGAVPSIAAHPITQLRELGFAVTINTDNRLMSGTSATKESYALVKEAGWTLEDLRGATLTAARGAFVHCDDVQRLVARVQAGFDAA